MASGLLASRKRRLIALGGVTAVAGAVLLYQAYHSETYSAARKYIARVKAALQRYSEGFFTAAELTASVLEDLRRYVQSEDSDLPQSLRQVLKLVESEEVGGATRALVTAAIRGVVASTTVTAAPTNGHAHGPTSGHSNASHTARLGSSQLDSHGSSAINIQLAGPDGRGLVDKVLEALVAPRGLNLVELVVRVAARNSVKEYCRFGDVDAWDQLIASISKPGHRETIERLTSVFVTDCIKAYFGTQRDDRGHEEYSRRTIVTPAQPAMPAHSLSATSSSPVAPITPLSQQPSSATRINAASGTSVSGPASPAEAVGEPGQQVQCASFGAEPQHAQQPAAACSAGISMPAAPAPAAAAGSFFMQEEQEVRWLGAEPTKQSSTSALAGFVQQLASHPEGRSLAVEQH
ncbi:hypothetical protein WJX72_011543 [[Myrmecia] bisecta]|uniref:Uncharacterized protein n=1 Tax=[Myrmecia] bisecta TaxID=41462 RepID=A0AAW1R8S5_9CHLO